MNVTTARSCGLGAFAHIFPRQVGVKRAKAHQKPHRPFFSSFHPLPHRSRLRLGFCFFPSSVLLCSIPSPPSPLRSQPSRPYLPPPLFPLQPCRERQVSRSRMMLWTRSLTISTTSWPLFQSTLKRSVLQVRNVCTNWQSASFASLSTDGVLVQAYSSHRRSIFRLTPHTSFLDHSGSVSPVHAVCRSDQELSSKRPPHWQQNLRP